MMTRILQVLAITVLLLLQYRMWVAEDGLRELWRLRQEVAQQREENAQLQERNRTLIAEVLDLKKGKAAVEERARTDLGMIGQDEVFFQVVMGTGTATAVPPPTQLTQVAHHPAAHSESQPEP